LACQKVHPAHLTICSIPSFLSHLSSHPILFRRTDFLGPPRSRKLSLPSRLRLLPWSGNDE
jgi:hypothetical protein